MKKRYSIVVFFIIATLKIFGQVNDTISIVTLDGIRITYFQSAQDNTFSHSSVIKNDLEVILNNVQITESIELLNNWIETTDQHIWTKTSEYKLNFLDKRVINRKMSYFSAVNTSQLEESIFHKRVLEELLVLFNIKEEIIEAPTYKIFVSNPDDFLPIWNKAVKNDFYYAPNVKFRNDTLLLEEYQISDLANFISEWYGIYICSTNYRDFCSLSD